VQELSYKWALAPEENTIGEILMFLRIMAVVIAGAMMGWAVWATVFGTVRGIAHDPQHRPIADMEVVLKAQNSDYTQTTFTNADGEFHFDAVPLGEYTVQVSKSGFAQMKRAGAAF
jgi:hypothetical protein